MTWKELKEKVEKYKFFDDDTEVMVYDHEKNLYIETDNELEFDFKGRIVLSINKKKNDESNWN